VDEEEVLRLLAWIAANSENEIAAVLFFVPINIHPVLPAEVLQVSTFEVVVATE
jgi:hypothetical protein